MLPSPAPDRQDRVVQRKVRDNQSGGGSVRGRLGPWPLGIVPGFPKRLVRSQFVNRGHENPQERRKPFDSAAQPETRVLTL
jgi:hypothetical protein